MTPSEYQELAKRTVCPQDIASKRIAERSPMSAPLLHAVIGIQGEAGELAAAAEKWLWYGQALDRVNVKEETGDLLWYIALLCNTLDLDLEDVMEANIAKLRKRFPEKYTDEKAREENRDRAAERQQLESAKLQQVEPALAAKLPDRTHEFDSSLTCNYCGRPAEVISKEHGGRAADYLICPERVCRNA